MEEKKQYARALEQKERKLEAENQRAREVAEEKRRQEDQKKREILKSLQDTQQKLEDLERSAKLQKQQKDKKMQQQQVRVDAAQVEMQDKLSKYINLIRIAVQKEWASIGVDKGLRVLYKLDLNESGVVIDIELDKSSGNSAYDESVRKAILIASPLPLTGIKPSFFNETFGRGVRIDFQF